MRILHCVSALDGGGAEKQLAYLVAEQLRQGLDVHIAHPVGGRRPGAILSTGAEMHPLVHLGTRDPLLLWRLGRLMRKLAPTIVQTWHFQMHVLAGLAALATGTPFVVRES